MHPHRSSRPPDPPRLLTGIRRGPATTAGLAALWALLAALAPAGPARGQSIPDVLQRMSDADAARLAGVHDLTLTATMGMGNVALPTPQPFAPRVVMYMEKRARDGKEVLLPVRTTVNGRDVGMPFTSTGLFEVGGVINEQWIERIHVVGHDEVDGHPVTVLEVTDFDGLPLVRVRPSGRQGVNWRMVRVRYLLDDEELVVRRTETEMAVPRDDGTVPVRTVTDFQDYRTVDGYVYPARVHWVTRGALYLTRMDPDSIRQRADTSGEASDGGTSEMVMVVTDVKVNAGPPRS